MATYEVILPIAGYVLVEVEANSEQEAIDNAFSSEITTNEIEEWDTYHHIVQGNVCHASEPHARATMVDDGRDD